MIALKNTTNNQIFYIIHRKMDGETGWDLMQLNLEYTENGQYSVIPPSGYDGFSAVNVTVDVDQSSCNLTTSTVPITTNGEHTITPPEGYDGFSEVVINVDVDQGADCETCYANGEADQKARMTNATFVENGSYTREDGWNAVTVNVDTVTPYNNGKQDGIDEQKSKLTSLNVSSNGTYRRPDGYNEVVVEVPSNVNNQNKQVTYSQNGTQTVTADLGYSGLGQVEVTVDVDTVTPYNNGYLAGEAAQKAKLTSTTFTSNDTYTRPDGWNQVTVNVDTVTPYNNGYADGERDQKNKLTTLYVTQNGTYSRADGYSSVLVDVDCGIAHSLVLSTNKLDVVYNGSEVPINGIEYQITLYSSCNWEVTSSPYWVSLGALSGTAGLQTYNLTITSFMDGNSGIIEFTNCDQTEQLVINLIDNEQQPLTMKVTHSGCLYWKQYGSAYNRPLDYDSDGDGVYRTIYSTESGNGCLVECLQEGDVIRFMSQPRDQQSDSSYSYFVFTDGLQGELSGNLNLFCNPAGTNGTYGCYKLFNGCGVVSAENLLIPAVSAHYCASMFSDCTALITAPKVLPDVSDYCYASMFYGCTNLEKAPELPARWLAPYCYAAMFRSCSSLVNAPELPATQGLATYCYSYMFADCNSLVESPYLATTSLNLQTMRSCYNGMFYSCSSLQRITSMVTAQPSNTFMADWVYGVAASGTFVKNPNASWTNTYGNNAIPSGWTVVMANV